MRLISIRRFHVGNFALILFSIWLELSRAMCPGATPCSGHGTCGAWDLCTCHRNWGGFDCSQRICPFGMAWSDIKDTSVSGREPHYYLECSGKGTCNTGTGVCACLEGFEGHACQRMSCPDDCNGHGLCELMSYVNTGYSKWDKDKVQVCVCDAGWTGTACEKRKCKTGDDPLTLHTVGGSAYQQDEIQTITFTDSGSGAITGTFTLTYTDWRGATWESRALDIATASAISVEEALEALPNQAIPSVTVAMTGTAASGTLAFAITFSSDATSGDQPALGVNHAGCNLDGCQPVYAGITVGGTLTVTVVETRKGTEENIECSKRGACNPTSGLCECYPGYYGEACQFQTIIT